MFFKSQNRIAKLELIGGQAKPGPALASLGINMVQFSKEFNERSSNRMGERIPVVIEIFPSKAFKFQLKTTPTATLIKKAVSLEKGSSKSKTDIVATLDYSKIVEIAKIKLEDSNTDNLDSMISMIIGTAKQMGVKVANKDSE
ncbi:50S ribosomal protein L11 [Mycoplasma ovis str. Michigan]|uniref:Large ribosomal subunit protein uL11 n=1 Tax=Mycoplasma ovis str. Michigan TaxID=1415773 RepID=A0ABM5P0A8_9MOLU|nr:50S ribosomal protein L11 [Mycoplasma ovis]AHC39844.1 50S ribosomal protein L11 [Mycoplasma ovis str. Michigan]